MARWLDTLAPVSLVDGGCGTCESVVCGSGEPST